MSAPSYTTVSLHCPATSPGYDNRPGKHRLVGAVKGAPYGYLFAVIFACLLPSTWQIHTGPTRTRIWVWRQGELGVGDTGGSSWFCEDMRHAVPTEALNGCDGCAYFGSDENSEVKSAVQVEKEPVSSATR